MFRRKLFIGGLILLGLYLPTSVYNMDLMNHINSPDFPLVIAHRGASGVAPENTLAAVNKALEIGADLIEVDVHLSKDGEVIVIHDAVLDRTTNGTGAIKDKTLAEIKSFDAGSWKNSQYANEKVPTLSEVMEAINGKAIALIEIKKGKERYQGLEQKVIDIIDQFEARDWSIVQSFETETVKETNRIAPELEVHKLISGKFPLVPVRTGSKKLVFKSALEYEKVKAVNPHFKALTKKLVKKIHRKDLKIFTYTVNEKEDMEALIKMGVDGIITNYPERLLELKEVKEK